MTMSETYTISAVKPNCFIGLVKHFSLRWHSPTTLDAHNFSDYQERD